MKLPRLILVGGFLGAGKTTLLAQAALRLAKLGKRVGLLANDQATDLVDTEVLRLTGACVEEVAGGCFCCRFDDMVAALSKMADRDSADVLLGEPVGSCTDLAATVMHPLRDLHAAQFDLAPLSVLVDGRQVRTLARLRAAVGVPASAGDSGEQPAKAGTPTPAEAGTPARQRFPDNVLYIYEKQLEEADLIVLNKADSMTAAELDELTASLAERFPQKPVVATSALTGEGVDAWLDRILYGGTAAGNIVDVDYDTYADGEAALGWLNASIALDAAETADWRDFAETLLTALRSALVAREAEIAHVKVLIQSGKQTLTGSLTGNSAPVSLCGSVTAAAGEAVMRLNARVHIPPGELRTICTNVLRLACSAAGLNPRTIALESLSPGRPVPTHRHIE